MAGTVSAAALLAMAAVFLISAGLPVLALLFVRKRLKSDMIPLLIGAGTFMVFALILEQLLHLGVNVLFGKQMAAHIWLYALYGGLAAGLFEETGRYLAMKFLMRKRLTKQNALMYGVGHGGAESILLIGITYISNIVLSVMINTGLLDMLLGGLGGPEQEALTAQLFALTTTAPGTFLLAGLERVSAFFLQLCLSYIVYRAVKDRRILFYFVAVAVHFAADACVVLLASSAPLWLTEIALAASVLILCIFIFRVYRTEREELPAYSTSQTDEKEQYE